jgi:hypothetical protein
MVNENGNLVKTPTDGSLYAEPRLETNIINCYFYHTMEIPGYGLITGAWDLRPNLDQYFGGVDFKDQRVLEIGTSSGFGCFSMEKLGAEVVAYDLSPDFSWDVVPFHNVDLQKRLEKMKSWIAGVNNAYWLGHQAFNSRAKMVYGTVYSIPEAIGMCDIVTICAVLMHLRDPFLAVQTAAKFARRTIVISDVIPEYVLNGNTSEICFRPALRLPRSSDVHGTWWYLPPQTIVDFLEVLGFAKTKITYHKQLWKCQNEFINLPFYSVVGSRE